MSSTLLAITDAALPHYDNVGIYIGGNPIANEAVERFIGATRPSIIRARLLAMQAAEDVARLAEELTDVVDGAAEGIGSARSAEAILRDLGPAVDRWRTLTPGGEPDRGRGGGV